MSYCLTSCTVFSFFLWQVWASLRMQGCSSKPCSHPTENDVYLSTFPAFSRAAAAGIAAHAGPLLRRAAVAQWEVRLPIAGGGAWRIVASSPTGDAGVKEQGSKAAKK